jgi:hypothetical protein
LFDSRDVDEFQKRWVYLGSLASQAHTTAFGLMRLCSRMKIMTIVVPRKSRGENQAFVPVEDVDRLLARALDVLGRGNRNARKRLRRAGVY